MIDFKNVIANELKKVTNIDNIGEYIEIPANKEMGDLSLPCFKLAKEMKKAPPIIANEINENLHLPAELFSKTEVVNGYLNFFINPTALIETVFEEFENKKDSYGSCNIGEGKTVVIDYSSPNIAKPFHIGHLKTTVLGGALYNIYKFLGYKVVGVNHLGDYGTQFGKLIEGYKRWGNEYDLSTDAIDKLGEIYKRINDLCSEDESVLEQCRENFKLLEAGDEYCTKLWKEFRDLSIDEFKKIYDLLGSKFDSWNGEAFYSDKTSEVIEILEKTGKLVESEGAKIIDLTDAGIETPCMICKSNGASIYATRDLAAILYRARTYDFDKCLYVTSYEQNLHFKQIFEVAKLLGLDEKYTKGLEHISYGMIQLPTGKMSTRKGNFVKVVDLLNDAISEAKSIIEEKNPDLENKDEIAKKVGIGAVIFNDLYNSRIKDEIFDLNTMLNFNGETGPYLQYMFVRTNSILNKVGSLPSTSDIDVSMLEDNASINLVKAIYEFGNIVMQAAEKNEPYIISRYLIKIAQLFSTFYNENRIIGEDKKVQDARIYLVYCTNLVLKSGANLLGMEMPNKM